MEGPSANPHSIQLIDEESNLNTSAFEDFVKEIKLQKHASLSVVAIIGRQASGKSTLMNKLFDCEFETRAEDDHGNRTTKGVWLAAKKDKNSSLTIVMDIEGSDGNDRPEGDNFEKETALLAVSVASVVLINIWKTDIGSRSGSDALLTPIFEVLKGNHTLHEKTTLMFVVRDMNISTEKTKERLEKNTLKLWNSKSDFHTFFHEIEFVALPHYQAPEFNQKVSMLRERICELGSRKHIPPPSFESTVCHIWKMTKQNEIIHLPNRLEAGGYQRCDEACDGIFRYFVEGSKIEEKIKDNLLIHLPDSFEPNKEWLALLNVVESRKVNDFGERLSSLINGCLKWYDESTKFYDNVRDIRSRKRNELINNLLQETEIAYKHMMKHVRFEIAKSLKDELREVSYEDNDIRLPQKMVNPASIILLYNGLKQYDIVANRCKNSAMEKFDRKCAGAKYKTAKWDCSEIKDQLERDIDKEIQDRKSKIINNTIGATCVGTTGTIALGALTGGLAVTLPALAQAAAPILTNPNAYQAAFTAFMGILKMLD